MQSSAIKLNNFTAAQLSRKGRNLFSNVKKKIDKKINKEISNHIPKKTQFCVESVKGFFTNTKYNYNSTN